MTPADRFIGRWELIPEMSLYAVGEPPAAGLYVIEEPVPGTMQFRVTWRMHGDQEDRSTGFAGPSDGSRTGLPVTVAGAPDALTITRVDERTLDSAALRGEERVAYARRVVSTDGALMAVVQEAVTPSGDRLRNFQVYRRAGISAG